MSTTPNDVDESPAPPHKGAVQLDPQLQARLLEQMHEEQEANMRKTAILNWIIVPLAVFSLVVGTVLMFSDDTSIAIAANLFASSVGYVLYRVNKPRIRAFLGLQ